MLCPVYNKLHSALSGLKMVYVMILNKKKYTVPLNVRFRPKNVYLSFKQIGMKMSEADIRFCGVY